MRTLPVSLYLTRRKSDKSMKTAIVLFLFKRRETLQSIIERVRQYSPTRLYLIADGPRTASEREAIELTRELAESLIDWECEIVRRYAPTNIGVYRNIGEGARWVLSMEERAIFLEDDSLPEITFFQYCDTLLDRYAQNDSVLWICGTNYMSDSSHIGDSSYYYTRLLLPCGWASWSKKFLRHYDGELSSLSENTVRMMEHTYIDRRLFFQERQTIKQTRFNFLRDPRLVSWDRQMAYSVRATGMYGIAPVRNQIRNIGVDEHSIHGGTSMEREMTRRFCEVPTSPLTFPLAAPPRLEVNRDFEAATERILLYPLSGRFRRYVGRAVKRLLGIDPDDSISLLLKSRKGLK